MDLIKEDGSTTRSLVLYNINYALHFLNPLIEKYEGYNYWLGTP